MPKKREILQEITFYEKGTFQSYYAAEGWLAHSGFSCGSMDGYNPIALRKGEWDLPEKWHNLNPAHKASIDGIMTSNDWRDGEVKVIIYK
jgi:hypothetical protein